MITGRTSLAAAATNPAIAAKKDAQEFQKAFELAVEKGFISTKFAYLSEKYIAASEESVKKAYITQDRLDFRHVSLSPGDQGALVKTLGITDIPFLLVLNKDLRIIYRSAGYPNGDAEEYSAFMKAPTALFNEIRGELDEMKTGDAK